MSDAAERPHDGSFTLDPGLWDEMMGHPGKWITASRTGIVAVGDSAREVLEVAREEGVDVPLLFLVPDDLDEGWVL